MNKNIPFRKYLLLLFVFLVIDLAPRAGSVLATRWQGLLGGIDPDRVFSWGLIHHLVQLLIVLFIILAWSRFQPAKFGFQVGNWRRGLRWTAYFSLVWIGIYAVLTVINISQGRTIQAYYDVTQPRNLLGELAFRGLVVGISEEIVFRAFPITLLVLYWPKKLELFRLKGQPILVSAAGVISAVLFVYAHIGYSLIPFQVHHFDLVQLFSAAGLGLFYAVVYEDTGSIWYPALIHSISDVIPVLSLYLLHLAGS